MDRQTVYSGQVPRTLDLLMAEQNTMVGLAKMTEATFGTSTLVDGFTCTPTTPASLNVLLTAGSIYQLENIEATTWSAVAADTSHSIVKQGIMLDAATLGITPPGTVGYSQVYLIEVQYADSDTGSTVLPYYNASNPAAPYSGPGNAGTAQNTVRKGIVAVQVKAGIAATTGTQVAPTADAGWIGLFTVTVANGASTVTSGNIAQLSSAPFLVADGKLPRIPYGVQSGEWVYAADSGAANALVVTLSPVPASYVAGMSFNVLVANANTGAATINVNGLGAKSIVHLDGVPLINNELLAGNLVRLSYDGTNFQVQTPPSPSAANRKFSTQKPSDQTLAALSTYYDVTWSAATCAFGTFNGTTFTFTQKATYLLYVGLDIGCSSSAAGYIHTSMNFVYNGANLGGCGDAQAFPQSANTYALVNWGTAIIEALPGDTLKIQGYSGGTAWTAGSVKTSSATIFNIMRIG